MTRIPPKLQRTRSLEVGKGIAWFPNPVKSRIAWVGAILDAWSEQDPDSLGFTLWQERAEWMTAEERSIRDDLETMERERREFLARQARQVAEVEERRSIVRREADAGVRRLLTAKDYDLVEAVSEALGVLGFEVESVDDSLGPAQARREDLRLTDADEPSWRAIVEVRGYAKSAGKTSDFQRLGRFAMMYERSEGHPPSQRLYVVNGQLDLPPDQRERPLAGATEDVEEFSQADGAVISTVDLFRVAVSSVPIDKASVRRAIRSARGLWTFEESSAAEHPDGEEEGDSD